MARIYRVSPIIAGLLSVLLGGCVLRDAPSPGSVMGMIDHNDRITATGYAVIELQPSDLPAQRRLLAIRASKLDAYRALAEQVYGQYVDSSTSVGDLVLLNDSFRSRVQGVIYGAELESIKPLGDDTYEVTLSLRRSVVNDLRKLYLQYMNERRV